MQDFEKSFNKRSLLCFVILVILFFVTGIKIYSVSTNTDYAATQISQATYRKTLGKLRGTIYDKNMIPLTNNKKTLYVAIPPTPDAIMNIKNFLSGTEKVKAIKELKENRVAICTPDYEPSNKNIAKTYIYKTDYTDFFYEHIVGYTDNDGHGVNGIEKAYDELLFSKKSADIVYSVSGKGKSLLGDSPYFQNDTSVINSGVVLTIDSKIQQIAYECSSRLEKGAIVIADANNGKIRALISKPSFSPDDLKNAVNDKNSPLLNRTLLPFSVGSVFKPCIASTAIENSFSDFEYTCLGKCQIDDRYFSCHEKQGHGQFNLCYALANSCNTYFYNLGILLGADKIQKTALKLSFGSSLKIADNIETDAGNITKLSNLKTNSSIANFSIGQGDILLSPINMLTLYLCIASDGTYNVPSVVEATVKNSKTTKYNIGNKTRVMNPSTAKMLRDYLREVVVSGTGQNGNSDKVNISGKTATAQTGRYIENREITNSWFCGFFPSENPKYVMIIMSDGLNHYPLTTIFKNIAEKIY